MRKRVMVFGVFDGLHEGHRAFLNEAKKCGNYLIAVVAPDHVVEHLKGRLPRLNLAERFEHLRLADHVDAVLVGDSEPNSWKVLDLHRPQVVALGYDQELLEAELEKYFEHADWQAELKVMKSHEAGKLHSSIITKPTF